MDAFLTQGPRLLQLPLDGGEGLGVGVGLGAGFGDGVGEGLGAGVAPFGCRPPLTQS